MITRTLTLSALGAAALVLAVAAPAGAHDYVVDSTPAEGETLSALPERWSITTESSMLELDGNDHAFAIVVTDEQGLYYGDGCVSVDGDTMTARAALGRAGDYTLAFQLVSADGHTVSDEYSFAYAPADGDVVTEGSPDAPSCGVGGADEAHDDAHGDDGHGDEHADEHADETAAQQDVEATATSATTAADAENAAVLGALAWIGGGLLAAAVIATIVVLANRRRAAGD